MCIQMAHATEDNFIVKIRKKTSFLSSMKKMFFCDVTRKTRTTCKLSNIFEDLSFLNPRCHLKAARCLRLVKCFTIFYFN